MPHVVLAAVALLAGCATSAPTARPSTPVPVSAAGQPRNVVFLIADGFGPASVAMGRSASRELGRPFALDAILSGSVETSATNSRVTDSAAGATAYACGLKTYNGAIAVDPDGTPCRTVLEAAEAAGLATGLVATSRITHATPASFAAHVTARSDEGEIARQLVGSGVEVLFGGGARFFIPSAEGGSRADGADLRQDARARGMAVATDRAAFDRLASTPALALLAPDHLAYDIDRGATDQPSLAELSTKALDLLASSADGRAHGFFLMIEGSRIDHAGHANDPAAHLRDILAYDATVAAVLDWARRDGNTLVVSTADHETGGMTLGRDGVYAWDPAPLLAATASLERMAEQVRTGQAPAETVRRGVGLEVLPEGAADALAGAAASGDAAALGVLVRDLESVPAGVGWTTTGHTAVDVDLFAFGPGSAAFRGALSNDAVGRALFAALGLSPGE